jgi:hypothetical protein
MRWQESQHLAAHINLSRWLLLNFHHAPFLHLKI